MTVLNILFLFLNWKLKKYKGASDSWCYKDEKIRKPRSYDVGKQGSMRWWLWCYADNAESIVVKCDDGDDDKEGHIGCEAGHDSAAVGKKPDWPCQNELWEDVRTRCENEM